MDEGKKGSDGSYEHKYSDTPESLRDDSPPPSSSSSSPSSSSSFSSSSTSVSTNALANAAPSTTPESGRLRDGELQPSTLPSSTSQKTSSNSGQVASVSSDPVARDIASGFRINYMTMRDAITGLEVWNSGRDWDDGLFENELVAHVPASILQCRAVAREINFSSREEIENFRLEQRVYFEGMLMEEWFFDFGFVIPGSTNTWQSTIEAAGEGQMLPAPLLNGKVQIVTSFFDGALFVSKSTVRVFYDA